ncbi:ammonium transporter [Helicobacter sp. 11S03491-1]|uniref:ammonium transporter n=1 Tax=Helicobacter sp. 11S03491-1 TaxID=1476196 RepID=UPI000BA63981|nr:ammonium transporter [Helicobacter sp. 11S03491-1]
MDGANTIFILFCTILVLLMTPALAMFYSGMVRSKNSLSVIMNCFVMFGIITFQWVGLGYTLAFGEDIGYGLLGNLDNMGLYGIEGNNEHGVPNSLFMIFQMMFAIIAAAIFTGSFVGRIKFSVLIIFTLIWTTLVYDLLAHWIWSQKGWLLQKGSLDFAGGGVVHISAGVAGLVGCFFLGKRKNISGIFPHSLPYSFLGAALLLFGWLGFNAGSAGGIDNIAVNAFITTCLSTAGGILGWITIEWIKYKKPTLLGAITGALAGLVGITPAAGYVSPLASILIGFLASPICFVAITWLKTKLNYDDSLDAFGLHGIGGIWGGIATGIFASASINPEATGEGTLGQGLLYSGNMALLTEQIFAIIICVALSGIVSLAGFKIISLFTSLRVNDKEELEGLDIGIHGEEAYRI